jgi:Tol biopolymer transport system component
MVDRIIKMALLTLFALLPGARASDNAVIIEAWSPEEAYSLDWGAQDIVKDELWNDAYMAFEMYCARPGIDSNPDQIHFLWADTVDYWRKGQRYNPLGRLRISRISDDTACIATITNTFNSLAGTMGQSDTLFCYTWGHGGHNGRPLCPSTATNFSIKVRPLATDLWDTDFAHIVDTVKSKRVFLMQQCFCGAFWSYLNDSNTVFLGAAPRAKSTRSADDESRAGSPLPEHEVNDDTTWRHAEFNFHLMNALRGTAIWSYGGGYDDPVAVNADYDSSGSVSWKEAYWYIDGHNSISRIHEYPVFFSPESAWHVKEWVGWPHGLYGAPVRYGGSLAWSLDSASIIYALKGNKSREFWAYDVASDSWHSCEDVPEGASGKGVKQGGTLASPGNGWVYATKGYNTLEFWKYNTLRDSWAAACSVPAGTKPRKLKAGAAAGVWSLANDSTFVYLLKVSGGVCEFYRYNCPANSWASKAPPPVTNGKKCGYGSSIAFDGDNHIYLLKNKTNDLFAYSISGDSWSARNPLPLVGRSGKRKKVRPGSALASCGGSLFALKGGGTDEFWVYQPEYNSWYQADSIPAGPSGKTYVKDGGALAQADGYVWAMRGGKTWDFLRFTPNLMYRNAPQPQVDSTPPGENELLVANGPCCASPAFSHSGVYVAFTKAAATGHPQVFRALANGGGVQQLTQLSTSCCLSPAWYYSDQKIAFLVEPDTGGATIGVVLSMGGPVVYLSSVTGDIEDFALSPSGASLVFSRSDSGDFTQLWICPLSGGGAIELTTSSRDHFQPHFASESTIVFRLDPPDAPSQIGKLYKYHSDTTNLSAYVWKETTLTSSAYEHSGPCVAESAGLAFFEVEGNDGYTMIGRVTLEGDSETVITSGSGAYDFEMPTVGPQGETLFCLRSTDAGAAVCEVYADGSGYTVLTDDEVERETPHARQNPGSPASATYVRDGSVYRTLGQGEQGGQGGVLGVFALEGIAPNPTRPKVNIHWQVPYLAKVRLQVYDPAGRLIKSLHSGEAKPGRYTTVWNGTDTKGRMVGTGIYFCRLETPTARISRKVVLTQRN